MPASIAARRAGVRSMLGRTGRDDDRTRSLRQNGATQRGASPVRIVLELPDAFALWRPAGLGLRSVGKATVRFGDAPARLQTVQLLMCASSDPRELSGHDDGHHAAGLPADVAAAHRPDVFDDADRAVVGARDAITNGKRPRRDSSRHGRDPTLCAGLVPSPTFRRSAQARSRVPRGRRTAPSASERGYDRRA